MQAEPCQLDGWQCGWNIIQFIRNSFSFFTFSRESKLSDGEPSRWSSEVLRHWSYNESRPVWPSGITKVDLVMSSIIYHFASMSIITLYSQQLVENLHHLWSLYKEDNDLIVNTNNCANAHGYTTQHTLCGVQSHEIEWRQVRHPAAAMLSTRIRGAALVQSKWFRRTRCCVITQHLEGPTISLVARCSTSPAASCPQPTHLGLSECSFSSYLHNSPHSREQLHSQPAFSEWGLKCEMIVQ